MTILVFVKHNHQISGLDCTEVCTFGVQIIFSGSENLVQSLQ